MNSVFLNYLYFSLNSLQKYIKTKIILEKLNKSKMLIKVQSREFHIWPILNIQLFEPNKTVR